MKPKQLSLPMAETPSMGYSAGAFRRKEAVQEAFKRALDNCFLSREEIAQEMTRLVGEKIGVSHIANWTAESKSNWRFPLEFAAAFFMITGDIRVMKAALEGSGINVMDDNDLLFYEIGKEVERARESKERLKQSRERLRRLKEQGRTKL